MHMFMSHSFYLVCFFCKHHSSQMTSSFIFEIIHKHITSHSQNFTCHFESHYKSNKPSQILEPLYQPWIPCSIFSFLVLLVIYIRNKPSHIRAFISTMNTLLYFLLQLLLATMSHLIVLSNNTPKPTRGLDALSISPFLVIDDKPIKAYKRYSITLLNSPI